MAEQITLSFAPTPPATKQRRSYTREEELDILSYYKENNLYKTCQRFDINSKNVLRWDKQEEKIKESKRG